MPEERTHAGQVELPDFVGLTVPVARKWGHDVGVVVTSVNLDGPPLGTLTWPGTWIVTAQEPASGSRMARGDIVKITFEKFSDGGDAGDREPRRPPPQPRVLRAEADPAEPD